MTNTTSPAIPSDHENRFGQFAKRLFRHKGAIVGLSFIVLVVLAAIFAPIVTGLDPNAQDYTAIRQGPSHLHWFGTDELGRDMFARVIYGARASLLAGLVSVMIAIAIGVPLGLVAGYFGGWTDVGISRVADAMLAMPFLILAISLAAFLGPSLINSMIAIGVTAAPLFVRLTRGQVISVKSEDYVEAARSMGNSHARIAFRHVLPNVLPALIVQATLTIAAAIISEASLSFLGLGQQPPAASWGSILNTAQRSLSTAPWIAAWPGMMIFLTVISFNLLGDGLRDAFDPRSR
ncbi:ABC transporter permease [Devosia sp. 919]|uniref:ABC transporter permease n=1 Tax=Devosia sp. 919 TaxID=2726065 RepID=UPI001557B767|nr:ABC transporter permease [Devosia sp. 919]